MPRPKASTRQAWDDEPTNAFSRLLEGLVTHLEAEVTALEAQVAVIRAEYAALSAPRRACRRQRPPVPLIPAGALGVEVGAWEVSWIRL